MASKEYLHRTPSKKAGREIIWGNHSLEAKEWFHQTLSKKTDWVKAGSKKSDCFSAGKKGGRSSERFPRAPSKKAGGEIIWGDHSLEAKERFPQTPSKKTDWVKAKNKKSARFSANSESGKKSAIFSLPKFSKYAWQGSRLMIK